MTTGLRRAGRFAVSLALGVSCIMGGESPNAAAASAALTLEHKVALDDVAGRIDHLAVDLARQRLFVAELGNGSLGVVDWEQRRVVHRVTGPEEPQGVAYSAASDTVYVAGGGDGILHRFHGADLAPLGSTKLGEDADNIRVDPQAGELVVGYGSALALVDASTGEKTGDIPLAGHPESFQLEAGGKRIFVNVPDVRQVAVVDRVAGRQAASWAVKGAQANFPMALDAAGERLMVVFRRPAELVVLDARDGKTIARLGTCGDADDIFFDARRQRAYISCGEGAIDVVQRQGDRYASVARVPTAAGARTALFVPELDRLFLAVRATDGSGAAIWVFRPSPSP